MKYLLTLLLVFSCVASDAPMPVTAPPSHVEPTPMVVPIVPAAIVIGAGVAAIGWLGIKAINRVIEIWENKVTNGPPPEVGLDLEIYKGPDGPTMYSPAGLLEYSTDLHTWEPAILVNRPCYISGFPEGYYRLTRRPPNQP